MRGTLLSKDGSGAVNKWTLTIVWLVAVMGTLWFSFYVQPEDGRASGMNTPQRAACNSMDAAQPCSKEDMQK